MGSPSHFEFSITADQQCIPQESYTRTTYCQNELHVQALISGVLLIKDLYLSEGLSPVDGLLIEKAFDSLFGNVGVSATIRSENSADGVLISFTIGIPVTYYGYTNTLYNGPHLTYLRAHDDILSFFRSNLFTSMLDTQIHAYMNQEQNTLATGKCHLKTHGAISLLSITESGWDNVVPSSDTIYPITYYPEDESTPSYNAKFSSFETGIPTFFIVILVGGTIVYFFILSKREPVSSVIKDFPASTSNSSPSYFKKHFKYIYDFTHVRPPATKPQANNYQELRTPSDDVEAHHDRKQSTSKVSI